MWDTRKEVRKRALISEVFFIEKNIEKAFKGKRKQKQEQNNFQKMDISNSKYSM